MSTFKSSADIVVVNNSGGTATITLCHQHTGGPIETQTWHVAANQITSPRSLPSTTRSPRLHGSSSSRNISPAIPGRDECAAQRS